MAKRPGPRMDGERRPVIVGVGGLELVRTGEDAEEGVFLRRPEATVMLTKRTSETRRVPMPAAKRIPPRNSTSETKRAV